MEQEALLPKNIRQIGDIRGREKICMEDYVMTYIRKKEPEEERGYLGIFLGEKKEMEESDYIFVRGILKIEEHGKKQKEKTEADAGEQTENTEEREDQEKREEKRQETLTEQIRREQRLYFPDWEIVGCCVIGRYPAERMEELMREIPEAGGLLYHLQEQEENFYWMREGQYQRIRGYFVFYEQNKLMQEYMSEEFGGNSVEKESIPDRAMKNFREKVAQKSEKKSRSMLKLASSFFVVTVLVIGAVMVNRVEEIRKIQSVEDFMGEKEEPEVSAVNEAAETEPEVSAVNVQAETEPEVSAVNVQAETEPEVSVVNAQAEAETETSAVNAQTETEPIPPSFWPEEYEDAQEAAAMRQTYAAYVIKEGDTLADICKRYYGSLEQLEEICAVNEIADANRIMPGQKIVLP